MNSSILYVEQIPECTRKDSVRTVLSFLYQVPNCGIAVGSDKTPKENISLYGKRETWYSKLLDGKFCSYLSDAFMHDFGFLLIDPYFVQALAWSNQIHSHLKLPSGWKLHLVFYWLHNYFVNMWACYQITISLHSVPTIADLIE